MRKTKLYFLIFLLALSLALPTTLAQRKNSKAPVNNSAAIGTKGAS